MSSDGIMLSATRVPTASSSLPKPVFTISLIGLRTHCGAGVDFTKEISVCSVSPIPVPSLYHISATATLGRSQTLGVGCLDDSMHHNHGDELLGRSCSHFSNRRRLWLGNLQAQPFGGALLSLPVSTLLKGGRISYLVRQVLRLSQLPSLLQPTLNRRGKSISAGRPRPPSSTKSTLRKMRTHVHLVQLLAPRTRRTPP